MISAFGVEHGDISKALGLARKVVTHRGGIMYDGGKLSTKAKPMDWREAHGGGQSFNTTKTTRKGTWAQKPIERTSTSTGGAFAHTVMTHTKSGGGLTRRGQAAVGGVGATPVVGGAAAYHKKKGKK